MSWVTMLSFLKFISCISIENTQIIYIFVRRMNSMNLKVIKKDLNIFSFQKEFLFRKFSHISFVKNHYCFMFSISGN